MYVHGSWRGRLSSRECEWPVSSGPSFPSCNRPFLCFSLYQLPRQTTANFSSFFFFPLLCCVVNVRARLHIFHPFYFIDDVRLEYLWAGFSTSTMAQIPFVVGLDPTLLLILGLLLPTLPVISCTPLFPLELLIWNVNYILNALFFLPKWSIQEVKKYSEKKYTKQLEKCRKERPNFD